MYLHPTVQTDGSSQSYQLSTIQCRRPKHWIKVFCISLLSQGTQWSTGQKERETAQVCSPVLTATSEQWSKIRV